ncbi:MAG: ATP-binding protein [Candidatus Obscuribacter sp.]|nr:ATP-binding protein [Candidatus Obscuribacter sp.]
MILQKEPVKMADIFEEVRLNLADWMAENKIRLKIHATGQGVMADREKLSRVIFNLVSNAIKFSPPDSLIVLSAARRGSSVEISVTDQGQGIAADKLETIFERFAQVTSPENKGKGGSGLGLTICRAIVNLHGGKIWAESEPGRGTKMVFTLPG